MDNNNEVIYLLDAAAGEDKEIRNMVRDEDHKTLGDGGIVDKDNVYHNVVVHPYACANQVIGSIILDLVAVDREVAMAFFTE